MHHQKNGEAARTEPRSQRRVAGGDGPAPAHLQPAAMDEGQRSPDGESPGQSERSQDPAQGPEQPGIAGEQGRAPPQTRRRDDGKQEKGAAEGGTGQSVAPGDDATP